MLLAEVIGSATCTIRVNSIKKAKFKIVKILYPDGKWAGSYSLVEDSIGTGFGEKVLIAEDEIAIAQMHDGKEDIPIRYCIVAKVENININS
jgi:microcompartment protein CcmK/EutM